MKYILKRNKKYHFKYRIPKILKFYFKQSSYFVKSLETENALIAQKNAKILLNKINYIKQSIEMNIENSKILELVEDLTNTTFNETENDLYNIDKVEDTVFALTLEDRLKSYQNAYAECNYELVENEAISILKSLNMKYNENDFNKICKQLLQNHIQNLKIIFEKIENREYYKPKKIEKVSENSKIIEEKPKAVEVKEEKLNSISLEEAYDLFEKNFKVSPNTMQNNKNYFRFLVKYLGKNREILHLRQKDFINLKPKLDKEISAKNELLATSTKKRYITLINKFLKFCYKNELIEKLSELDNYKVSIEEKVTTKKENYSYEEIGKWHNWAININEDNNLKWITLLSIYHGLTISEITRLEKHNILKEKNIFCIQIEFTIKKGTKNINRIRIVPMHPRLVELGFLDYVNSLNDGFIFTINNKQFSRKMTDINREFVTKNPKRTFHRIRGSFINNLVQSGERAEYVAAIVGHSQEYKITLEDYAYNINRKLLTDCLLKLNYKF